MVTPSSTMSRSSRKPEPPKVPSNADEKSRGETGREARQLDRVQRLLVKMDEYDRNALLTFAARLIHRSRTK